MIHLEQFGDSDKTKAFGGQSRENGRHRCNGRRVDVMRKDNGACLGFRQNHRLYVIGIASRIDLDLSRASDIDLRGRSLWQNHLCVTKRPLLRGAHRVLFQAFA